MTPARVLMTADSVGGVWTYALDLAAGLAPRGTRTTLATLGPAPSAAQAAAARLIPGLDLVALDHPLDWTAADAAEVRRAGEAVATLAQIAGVDLVHLNSPALAAGVAFPVPVIAWCHSCVRTWWEAVRGGPLPPDLAWRAALVAEGYAAADRLVAPSRAFADATARAYGLDRAPGVVPNGRALPPPAPTSPAVAPFAFTAGRLWDDGKNLAVLDGAATRLAIPIRAAGPTEGPNGARVALPNLQRLGRLDPASIDAQLRQRPIFLAPSRYEPFGLAVLEAAGHGCPLVLSDIPTFRELWDRAARFVRADDPAAWAEAVAALVADPDAADDAGKAAAERARHYGLARAVAGTLAAYEAAGRPRRLAATLTSIETAPA